MSAKINTDNQPGIREVFDIDFLQRFQNSFSKTVGVASLITDQDGNPVTQGSGFTDFCMNQNRGCTKGAERCRRSDAHGGAESARTGKPAVYFCENGLMDFAAPIMISGRQIGSFLGGQILPKEPDLEHFRAIALEIGADPELYLKALRKIPVVSESRIRAAAEMLYIVTEQISAMGYQRLVMQQTAEALNQKVLHIMAVTEELTAAAANISETQQHLNSEIRNIHKVSEAINSVSNAIRGIANDTRLLGLNAAIEAAKAGTYGLGFGVVAQEIRRLSGDSRETVDRIQEFTNQIHATVDRTTEMSGATQEMTGQQEEAIREMVDWIQEIMDLTGILNSLTDSDITPIATSSADRSA